MDEVAAAGSRLVLHQRAPRHRDDRPRRGGIYTVSAFGERVRTLAVGEKLDLPLFGVLDQSVVSLPR
jgi:hypothetical protein